MNAAGKRADQQGRSPGYSKSRALKVRKQRPGRAGSIGSLHPPQLRPEAGRGAAPMAERLSALQGRPAARASASRHRKFQQQLYGATGGRRQLRDGFLERFSARLTERPGLRWVVIFLLGAPCLPGCMPAWRRCSRPPWVVGVPCSILGRKNPGKTDEKPRAEMAVRNVWGAYVCLFVRIPAFRSEFSGAGWFLLV